MSSVASHITGNWTLFNSLFRLTMMATTKFIITGPSWPVVCPHRGPLCRKHSQVITPSWKMQTKILCIACCSEVTLWLFFFFKIQTEDTTKSTNKAEIQSVSSLIYFLYIYNDCLQYHVKTGQAIICSLGSINKMSALVQITDGCLKRWHTITWTYHGAVYRYINASLYLNELE